MKKRNGSKKVLRAMALGLATMIAVTSVPVTTFAGDGESGSTTTTTTTTTTTSVSTTTSEPQSSEPSSDPQPSSGSQQASNLTPATITVIDQTEAKKEVNEAIQTPVVITKDGTVINSGEKLNEKYPVTNPSEDAAAGLDAYGNKNTLDQKQGQYINNVPGYIDESMDLTKEALENVIKFGQSDAKITGLKNDANNELAGADAKIIAELVDETDENGNLIYEQETDENGNPITDGDGNPVYKMEPVYVQALDINNNPIYDENGAPRLVQKLDATGQPVMQKVTKKKLVYKDATDIETKKAVNGTETGLSDARSDIKTANTSSNENEARAAAAKIKSDLETAEQGLKDMGKILSDAADRYDETQTKYNAAQKKLYEAEQELATQKEYLEIAIKDSAAAHAALEATEKKVAEIKAEVEGLYAENDAAELELISKLYDAFKKNDNGKNVWVNAGNLCKALIKYYITHDPSYGYVDGFAISGGIDGVKEEDYADLSKELLSYSKEVIDTFEKKNTTDDDGNPMITYTPKDATEYDFPGSTYDGKTYEWKTIGGEKTGWVSAKGYDENNVVVVRYKYKDGDEIKEAERYFNVKIENGEIYFYERTIKVVTDEENSIAAKAGELKLDDFFVGGEDGNADITTTQFSELYNEEAGNLDQVIESEDGNKKTVPGAERKDTYFENSDLPQYDDDTKSKYELLDGTKTVYELGDTYVIDKDRQGEKKIIDVSVEPKKGTKDSILEEIKSLTNAENGQYKYSDGYTVKVEFDSLASEVLNWFGIDTSVEVDNDLKIQNWLGSIDQILADFFGTAQYSIEVAHTAKKVDGVIKKEIQTYKETKEISTDAGTKNKPNDSTHFGSKEAAEAQARTLVNTLVETKLDELELTEANKVEGTDNQYYKDINKLDVNGDPILDAQGNPVIVRTIYTFNKTITHKHEYEGSGLEKLWSWITSDDYYTIGDSGLTVSTTVQEIGAVDHVKKTWGYDPTEYYHYREWIAGNNGLTLQKIEWSADLKKDDEKSMDAGLVKSYISYRDAMKELQEAYDKVKAAEEKSKKLEEKIAALEQQTVDRSELNKLQRELANAKSALDRANADLENKQSEYNELLEAEIDLSRFDHHEGHQAPDEDPVAEETYFGPVIPTSPVPGGIAPASDPSGVAGARTGRRSGSRGQERGVAGVRVDDGNEVKNNKPVVVSEIDNSGKDQSVKNLQKVETPETPLAATPFKEDPVNPAIVGISIAALLAVLAGLYYEYNRRKKAKAEEMKKYQKN